MSRSVQQFDIRILPLDRANADKQVSIVKIPFSLHTLAPAAKPSSHKYLRTFLDL